jgi:hypothetical protein
MYTNNMSHPSRVKAAKRLFLPANPVPFLAETEYFYR